MPLSQTAMAMAGDAAKKPRQALHSTKAEEDLEDVAMRNHDLTHALCLVTSFGGCKQRSAGTFVARCLLFKSF